MKRNRAIALFATTCLFTSAQAFAREDSIPPANGERDATEAALSWRERVEEARGQYEAFAARATADRQSFVDEQPYAAAASTSHFTDSTLRAGDVVVTRQGLLIFMGADRFPYGDRDFHRIDEPLTTPLPHHNLLLEIVKTGAHRDR